MKGTIMKLSLSLKLFASAVSLTQVFLVGTSFAQDFLPAKIINARTGETIAVKCYDLQNNQCTRFQYFVADSENGSYRQLSNIVDASSIQKLLDQKRNRVPRDPEDMCDSNRLFAVSESSGAGMSLLEKGNPEFDGNGGMFGEITRDAYRRGKYESDGLYVLHAAGSTVGIAFVWGLMGIPMSAVFVAADVVLWPVRIGAKIVNALNHPNKEVRGSRRRNLKATSGVQSEILSGQESLHLGTSVWKKIHDGVSTL